MSNSNTFSRDNKAAKSNKGIARPKDKIIGNSSTEDWLNDFDDDLSMMGYRDDSPYRERSSIDIHTPTGMIDMSATGIPLMANGQYLPPYSGIHNMGTPYVREERMAKYGGGLPKAQKGKVQVEQKINSWLGEPMKKAQKAAVGDKWFNPKTKQWEQEDEVDNFRHPMAGRYTAEAIANKFPDWLKYTGLPQAAGFIGANALGIGHEATSNKFVDPKGYKNYTEWEAVREAGEDIFNNAVGAGIGVLPMSDDQKTKILFNLSKNNQLPDGYGKGNMYFKPFGGQNTKTHTHMANGGWLDAFEDGGDLKKYQGDVDGSQVANLSNQFIYPSGFQYAENTPLQNRAQACQGPDCLAGANTYYNKYVAPKFGLPNTWKINEGYGIVSGDPNQPYGVTADSWDLAALMQAKGAIQNYAAPLYEADKKTRKDQAAAAKYWKSKTDEEKRNIYSQLALGTLVNFGDWGGLHGERLEGANEKAGLYPSRHSTKVVGFTEDGIPMIYDMGQIRRIDDPKYDFPITNITTPKELSKYNYQYVKDWESKNNKKLNYDPKEKLLLTKGSQRSGEDPFTDEEFKYVEGINKNIKNLMQATGASQEDIIKAGKVAFGIMQGETRGGRGEAKAKLKEFVKTFIPFSEEGSKGLTRIKPEMQAGDETNAYSQYLKTLGLDPKKLDLWDPEQAALATTALILSRKGDLEGVDKWYLRAQQHNTPGVGPKNEQRLKEADKDYASNVIKNTARLYSTNTGYGLPETEKWMTKKQSERLKQEAAQSKKEGAKAFSEALKPKVMASESTGYSPKFIPISQLTKKEMGGESGWIDEYDLPRAQVGLQAVSTYPSSKEQNTIISMSDERRAYEQNLANEKANREYNAIKGGLNVAGLFYYPASVAASALEFSEGNYGQGAAGLVPFIGPASRANTARNILNQASRNLLTKSYNAGIPYKIAAPIIKGAKKTTMYGANAVNAQDAYDAFTDLDEQRYGGVKKYKGLPKGTTKNVVKGINKLFAPDPKLFGPFGRKLFDPRSKFEDGGWLDQYQTKGEVPKSDSKHYYTSDLKDYLYRRKMYDDSLALNKYSDAQLKKWIDIGKGELRVRAPLNKSYKHGEEGNWSPNIKSGDLITDYFNNKIQPSAQYDFSGEQKYQNINNLYKKPTQQVYYVQPKPYILKGEDRHSLKKTLTPIKKKPEVITPEYLPMIEARMPDMSLEEPNITPKFIFPKRQSNSNSRISWTIDPATRKMVPVYLEGKQKVATGKRLYNKNIPTSTMAIPEDFEPQFDRPEIVETTDPYWRKEYAQPKKVANKKYGGWLDSYK